MATARNERKRGKALRETLPRSGHGDLRLSDDRDPIGVLEHQHTSRLADLVPVRIGRMLQSPFAFYRGTAAQMATDLRDDATTGLRVVSCGDAHISNFGLFASPERFYHQVDTTAIEELLSEDEDIKLTRKIAKKARKRTADRVLSKITTALRTAPCASSTSHP